MSIAARALALRADPTPAPAPVSTFRWATVITADPLEVRFDGDTDLIPSVPDSLVALAALTVGRRVWVQLYGRRLIILGVSGGP